MRKYLLLSAAVALFAFVVVDEASAQRGGGGFRGGMGGGFRGGMVGGGFRGGMVGGGFRGAAFGPGRVGFVGRPGFVGGARWAGRPGWGGRYAAWGGYPYRYGYGWRRGWGWPVAAGLGFGLLASSAYYDSCWRYDGWRWVNVCNGPYGYRYW